MKVSLVNEIIDCLPKDRTLYRYFKDAYAVSLLRRYLRRNGSQRLARLKQSKYGKLLNKPVFANMLSDLGDGILSCRHLDGIWPLEFEHYVLTLGVWGSDRAYGWEQVSRPGANLVLQLNFCNKHDRLFRFSIGDDMDEFQYGCHPTSKRRCTMAWARIDLDFGSDQALIEEIQTDWLRDVSWLEKDYIAAAKTDADYFYFNRQRLYLDRVSRYLQEVKKHQRLWSEAMLNAAINFIHGELGIRTIFYHSYTTGALLKHLTYSRPPRSLYTELPKRFCFDRVETGPDFIAGDKKARRRLKTVRQQHWFRLA